MSSMLQEAGSVEFTSLLCLRTDPHYMDSFGGPGSKRSCNTLEALLLPVTQYKKTSPRAQEYFKPLHTIKNEYLIVK